MWNFVEKKGLKSELRTKDLLQTPNVKTNTSVDNSLISRGAHLWNTLPDNIKKMLTQLRYLKERSNNVMGINATARCLNKQMNTDGYISHNHIINCLIQSNLAYL